MNKKRQSTIARLPEEEVSIPKKKRKMSEEENNELLLSLIKKGGKSARKEEELKVYKKLTIRLPEDVNERVTSASNSRIIPMSNHSWLLEAVYEKLKKEGY